MICKNHIDLIGYLGREPEVVYRPDKTILNARLSLATTERWTDAAGQKQERTEWHHIVFWDRMAGLVAKLAHKGALVEVEGSLYSSTYEKDGAKRTSWEVRGTQFRLFPSLSEPAAGQQPVIDEADPHDDDIPL